MCGFLCTGVTNACSKSSGSFPVSYDCWKMWVIIGVICFAVSLRTGWEFIWACSFVLALFNVIVNKVFVRFC